MDLTKSQIIVDGMAQVVDVVTGERWRAVYPTIEQVKAGERITCTTAPLASDIATNTIDVAMLHYWREHSTDNKGMVGCGDVAINEVALQRHKGVARLTELAGERCLAFDLTASDNEIINAYNEIFNGTNNG